MVRSTARILVTLAAAALFCASFAQAQVFDEVREYDLSWLKAPEGALIVQNTVTAGRQVGFVPLPKVSIRSQVVYDPIAGTIQDVYSSGGTSLTNTPSPPTSLNAPNTQSSGGFTSPLGGSTGAGGGTLLDKADREIRQVIRSLG